MKARHHAAGLCPWCNPHAPFPGIAVVDWLAQERTRLLHTGDTAELTAALAALTAQAAVVRQRYPAAQHGMLWVAV